MFNKKLSQNNNSRQDGTEIQTFRCVAFVPDWTQISHRCQFYVWLLPPSSRLCSCSSVCCLFTCLSPVFCINCQMDFRETRWVCHELRRKMFISGADLGKGGGFYSTYFIIMEIVRGKINSSTFRRLISAPRRVEVAWSCVATNRNLQLASKCAAKLRDAVKH